MEGGKESVLGVLVDATTYDAAVSAVIDAAHAHRPFALTALAVHGVMTGVGDKTHAGRVNSFDLVTPDGQPVRWALRLLHGRRLPERVYGPALMMRVLERAADEALPVFLYGSTQRTLDALVDSLRARIARLRIAGAEPSKFRDARPHEADAIAARIASSGARLVFVGLGCPRQEAFAYAMRPRLSMPLLAVGAAFDYHAGLLPVPPRWMQDRGLEWAWRLAHDPARLWRRYLLLNPAYVARLTAQKTKLWRPRVEPPPDGVPDTFPV